MNENTKPREMIGDIPVYCAHDDIIDVGKAIPNPKNPNHHPQSQVSLLAKIIKSQGWRQPITISNRSGLIVKGHGRLLAAIELGADKVPVEYQEYETEADEIADLTADNRLAELAEMETDSLTEILQELKEEGFDIELAGYTSEDLEKLLEDFTTMDPPEDQEEEEKLVDGIAQPGNVYWLKGSRIICGLGTEPEDIENLKYIDAMVELWEELSGEKAVLVAPQEPENEAVGGDHE